MTHASRGFRTLPPQIAKVERWTVSLEEGPSYDNVDVAIDWTYYQGIQASAEVLIEQDALASSVGLPADAIFGISLAWRSKRVGLRGASPAQQVLGGEIAVQVDIPRGDVGGVMWLEARIILLDPGSGVSDPFAPREVGATLWSAEHRVTLEGVAPRLPIIPSPPDQVPFMDLHNARWFIQLETMDLEAPFDAAVRVYVNQGNESVRRLLDEPTSETAAALGSSLLIDIQRELMRAAFSDDAAFQPDRDYTDGSVGAVIAASLELFADDHEILRNRWELSHAELDVEIQGRLGKERHHD